MDKDTKKLATIIERLLLLVCIDEQIMDFNYRINSKFRDHQDDPTVMETLKVLDKNKAKKVLIKIRRTVRQSIQLDLTNILEERNIQPFNEIRSFPSYEDIDDTEMRIRDSLNKIVRRSNLCKSKRKKEE